MRNPVTTIAVVGFLLTSIVSCGGNPSAIRPVSTATISPPLNKEEAKTNLRLQAQVAADATVSEDWDKLIDSTHPKVIDAMGGRNKAKLIMKQGMGGNDQNGFKVLSCECGIPSEIHTGSGKWFAIVPAPMLMQAKNGQKFMGAGAMLGISADGGRTWKFVSASGTSSYKPGLIKLFPDIPDSLEFPNGHLPIVLDD